MFDFLFGNKEGEETKHDILRDIPLDRKLDILVENSPEAVVITDLKFSILKASKEVARLCGTKSTKDLIGKNTSGYLAKGALKPFMTNAKNFFKTGTIKNLQVRLKKLDGTEYDGIIDAKLVKNKKSDKKYIIAIIQKKQTFTISEENFRHLIQNAPIALYYNDMKGTLIYANKKAEELFGYKLSDLQGSNITKLKILDRKYWLTAAKQLALSNLGRPTGPVELEFTKKNGQKIWVSISSSILNLDDKKVAFASMIDITDQKKAFGKLKQSQQKYQDMFEYSQDLLVVLDNSGNIIDINTAVSKLLGYKKEETVGKNIARFISPKHLPRAIKLLLEDYMGKSSSAFVMDLKTKDKRWVPVEFVEGSVKIKDAKGKIVGLMYSGRNVETYEGALKDLSQSLSITQKVLSSIDDAVFIMDNDSPPVIVSCNQAVEKIFGYKAKDIEGNNENKLHVDKDHQKTFQEVLSNAIEKKGSLRDFEYEMKRSDSTIIPTKHTFLPLKDDKNVRIGWISIIKDLTERKKSIAQICSSLEINNKIIQNIPLAMYTINQKGLVEDVNDAGIIFSQAKRDKIIGTSVFKAKSLIKIGLDKEIKKCLSGTYFSLTKVRYEKNFSKEISYINIYGIPFEVGNEKKLILIYEDITDYIHTQKKVEKSQEKLEDFARKLQSELVEREKIQREVIESKKNYQLIFDTSDDAIMINRISNDKPSYFIQVNKTAIQRYGYSEKEFFKMTPYKLDDPAIVSKVVPKAMKEIAKKGKAKFETVHIAKNGKKIPVDIQAHIIDYQGEKCILTNSRDISDRIQAQKDIQEKIGNLERINNIMVGRELKMIELKEIIQKLQEKLRKYENT